MAPPKPRHYTTLASELNPDEKSDGEIGRAAPTNRLAAALRSIVLAVAPTVIAPVIVVPMIMAGEVEQAVAMIPMVTVHAGIALRLRRRRRCNNDHTLPWRIRRPITIIAILIHGVARPRRLLLREPRFSHIIARVVCRRIVVRVVGSDARRHWLH
jgi:hypothetical protein